MTRSHPSGDHDRATATADQNEGLVTSVSWAVAARDAAIELGHTEAAAELAKQAQEAIAAAQDAGISREQLAHELDYPGGAAALDPAAVSDRADLQAPSTAEIAARIQALRSDAVADVDPARREQLARWHHDDRVVEIGLGTDDGATHEAETRADDRY